MQQLNKYCGSLPHDKFSADLSFDTSYRNFEGPNSIKMCVATITLPKNSPFKMPVTSNSYDNEEDAKKSAALKTCRILHERKELNNNLMPVKLKEDKSLLTVLDVSFENVENSLPQPGTNRRKQVYERKLCSHFKYNDVLNDSCKYYLHVIDLKVSEPTLIGKRCLGILLSDKVDKCHFSLFCHDLAEVNVAVRFLKITYISKSQLQSIENFHKFIFKLFLKLDRLGQTNLAFNCEKAGTSVLVVPLIPIQTSFSIDDEQLRLLATHEIGYDMNYNFTIQNQNYMDAIVYPNHRNPPEYFFVERRCSETALSAFPDNKDIYSNYKEFYQKAYEVDIKCDHDNLLQCKHISTEVNKITIKATRRHSRHPDKHPKFPPELCNVIPIPASLYFQIVLLPSILYRLNGLLLEQELYFIVGYLASESEEIKFCSKPLDFHWCNKVINKCTTNDRNLCDYLRSKNAMSIYPGMLLQALTPMSANDNFNLERLEFIGDSFLKFVCSLHLFFKEKDNHEDKLTTQRSHMICNKSLYANAKKKELASYIQSFKLERHTAMPYGFYLPEDVITLLRSKSVDATEWLSCLEVNKNCSICISIYIHICVCVRQKVTIIHSYSLLKSNF